MYPYLKLIVRSLSSVHEKKWSIFSVFHEFRNYNVKEENTKHNENNYNYPGLLSSYEY